MVKEGKYTLMKDIPLSGEGKIKAGTSIYLSEGVFYVEGGLLDEYFQKDFRALLEKETKYGWNYLKSDEF